MDGAALTESGSPRFSRIRSNYSLEQLGKLIPDFLKNHPESDATSVRISPNTWQGTRTLGCQHFLVTFEVGWEQT
jgi:hypothetical protein